MLFGLGGYIFYDKMLYSSSKLTNKVSNGNKRGNDIDNVKDTLENQVGALAITVFLVLSLYNRFNMTGCDSNIYYTDKFFNVSDVTE